MENILKIESIEKYYGNKSSLTKAINNISFQVFKRYQTKEKDYRQQENKLDNQRQWYARANKEEKAKIAPSILDLEKRVRQMSRELDEEAIIIRNTEIQYKK